MTELIGVCIGALIVLISTGLNNAYQQRQERQQKEIREKMKEIDCLLLLNEKINIILQKHPIDAARFISFDAFDDCFITIDDYVYLQSFCAQNHFYLPNYLIEKFFQEIAHRQVVLRPDEVSQLGAYTYRGGRLILQNLSDELIKCIEDRRIDLKRIQQKKISYFHR